MKRRLEMLLTKGFSNDSNDYKGTATSNLEGEYAHNASLAPDSGGWYYN